MEGVPDTLAALAVPIEDLHPYGRNARRGDVAGIADSLRVHGQYRPVVANRRTGEVLAGNHTLAAARSLGWSHLAVTWVDVDDDQAARIVLVDNKSNDDAGYDEALLAEILSGLDDLSGTGWSAAELDELLAQVTELPAALADPDEAPPLPAEPVSKPGDVWVLGEHRLVCGDATDVGVYDALLGGDRVHMVWTDPPYGVEIVGGSHALPPEKRRAAGAHAIQNDGPDLEQLTDLMRAAFNAIYAATQPGALWYVAAPHGPTGYAFSVALTELGVWRHSLVWVKDSLVLGRSDYHWRHEAIYYGWTPGAGRLVPVTDRTQDSVWEVPRPKSSADHPTMKPVELITRALENSSHWGDLVLDAFGGSGSTLIAAHLTGRRARLIELDPRYADVICRRWQDVSGDKPVLESTGEPHDFTA